MAKTTVPPNEDTVVHAGSAGGVIIANGGSSLMGLNTSDPSVAGWAIELASGDSVFMEPGSAWAAETWHAWAPNGTIAVVTTI